MPSLLELQERFAVALESGDSASVRGVAVYRHAIRANYRRALAATYPIVRELLGAAAFDEAVDAFVQAHPPVSGDLNEYGDAFSAFLERHAPARADARDMARLEWAIDESARAGETGTTPASVTAALADLQEEEVARITLRVHPSCRLVSSAAGVYGAWSARQGAPMPFAPPRGGCGQTEFLLVRCHDSRTLVERIDSGEFAWVRALRAGETFGDALERALESDARFDLEGALSGRVRDGTICGVGPRRYNPRHG